MSRNYADPLAPGTLVIVGHTLGEILRPRRLHGRADGYDVMFSEHPDPQVGGCGPTVSWCEAWYVKRAELGVNVCRTPRQRRVCACTCGLVHIPHPEWLAAPRGPAGRGTPLKTAEVAGSTPAEGTTT